VIYKLIENIVEEKATQAMTYFKTWTAAQTPAIVEKRSYSIPI
jgi:hypothetical protein